MAQVVLKHVWKRYGEVVAVRDFDLVMNDKEFVVLVGPSGCGKSTTLRMIAGLEEISEGEVYIGDKLVNHVPPKDRDIAMVFQNYALYPHWTVFDNMAFGLRLRKTPKEEVRRLVLTAAKTLEIDHLLERKPRALSGGQRQRVAMGRAIVRDPKVFLFDEPLSNLDAKLRVQMRVEISRLHNRLNTTIVYVTHDQVEAMTLADRIVIMNDGLVQQVGSPLEVYEKPANLFVGTFIGSPAMNVIEADFDGQRITAEGLDIRPNPEQLERIGHERGPITVGIRPQHLSSGGSGGSTLVGRVDVVEHLGSEQFVYFSVGDSTLVARLEGKGTTVEGEITTFSIDVAEIHLFAQSGISLLAPALEETA